MGGPASWLVLPLLVRTCLGALYTDPVQLTKSSYDFVIVGAGTAGNVLANRLTENPNFSVLVIEAGGSNQGVINTVVPFLAPLLSGNTNVTWGYSTIPQAGFNGRSVNYPRGRILGGSSTINFQVYTRGARDDFDLLSKYTGDAGWSWRALQPYIFKHEKLVPPADNHDTTGQVNPAVHGQNGPLLVSLPGYLTTLDEHVIDTTAELAREFPFNLDMNSGNLIGVGWTQSTVGNSRRSSSATAYLEPVIGRENLDVLINTHVTKLLQTGTQDRRRVFKGVEFAQSASGPRFSVNATKEVILAAGVTNTPQILILSGIGPRSALTALNITPIVDVPAIGANLADHPLACANFRVNSTTTFDDVLRNTTLTAQAFAEWNTTGQGLFAGPGSRANQLAFLRLPRNDPIWRRERDPASGPTAGHYEFVISNSFRPLAEPLPPTGNFISICVALATPTSVGSITLNSTDPFHAPLIDPAFLTSPFDIYTMVYAFKAIRRFLSAPTWASLDPQPHGALANATTDAALEAHIRRVAANIQHPVGTAAIVSARPGGKSGAVNRRLELVGVEGVRVVDGSVFPFIPSAHPQAPIYIIAERAADLIKSKYS